MFSKKRDSPQRCGLIHLDLQMYLDKEMYLDEMIHLEGKFNLRSELKSKLKSHI